jgi:hypothetical protein
MYAGSPGVHVPLTVVAQDPRGGALGSARHATVGLPLKPVLQVAVQLLPTAALAHVLGNAPLVTDTEGTPAHVGVTAAQSAATAWHKKGAEQQALAARLLEGVGGSIDLDEGSPMVHLASLFSILKCEEGGKGENNVLHSVQYSNSASLFCTYLPKPASTRARTPYLRYKIH